MSRPKKTPAPAAPAHFVINPPAPAPEPEAERTPDEETLDEVLQQLPDQTVAKIYRIREDGQREFVAQVAPSAATEERCAKAGPGTYRVIFWGPKGDGSRQHGFRAQKTIYVGVDQAATVAAVTAPSPNGSGTSSLDAAVATMLTGMISQQSQAAQQQAVATQTMMTMMMTMMKDHSAVMQAQIGALTKPSADPLDQAERLTKILQPPKAGGFTDFMKDYAAFKELLGDRDGGDGAGPHWMAQIAREVVPHLLKQPATPTEALAMPSPAPSPRVVAVEPLPEPVSVRPEPTEIPTMALPDYLHPFANLLPQLRTAQSFNLSPETVAQAILDAIDDDDALEALLARPGLVADIRQAAPDLQVQWLDEIRQTALDALRESVETDDADDDRIDDRASAAGGG